MIAPLIGALAAVYLIWGSTYLAIAIAVKGLPPLTSAGLRFLPAGLLLIAVCRWRGVVMPSRRQWLHGFLLGVLMLGFGNGLVCIGEQQVASGLTAMILAGTPAVIVLLHWWLDGRRPTAWSVAGIALGVIGVVLLCAGMSWDGRAPWSAVGSIVVAGASWALAVALLPRLHQPQDTLLRSALPMLCGGLMLLAAGTALGEPWRITASPALWPAIAAVFYLTLFGSIIAYTAYLWLQKNAAPGLATSNVYVNPLIAIVLGHLLLGESMHASDLLGCAAVLAAVGVLAVDDVRRRSAEPQGSGEDRPVLTGPRSDRQR